MRNVLEINAEEIKENYELKKITSEFESESFRKEAYIKLSCLNSLAKFFYENGTDCSVRNSLFFSKNFYQTTGITDFYINDNLFDLIIIDKASQKPLFSLKESQIRADVSHYVFIQVGKDFSDVEVLGFCEKNALAHVLSEKLMSPELLEPVVNAGKIPQNPLQFNIEEIEEQFFELLSNYSDNNVDENLFGELASILYHSQKARDIFKEINRIEEIGNALEGDETYFKDYSLSVLSGAHIEEINDPAEEVIDLEETNNEEETPFEEAFEDFEEERQEEISDDTEGEGDLSEDISELELLDEYLSDLDELELLDEYEITEEENKTDNGIDAGDIISGAIGLAAGGVIAAGGIAAASAAGAAGAAALNSAAAEAAINAAGAIIEGGASVIENIAENVFEADKEEHGDDDFNQEPLELVEETIEELDFEIEDLEETFEQAEEETSEEAMQQDEEEFSIDIQSEDADYTQYEQTDKNGDDFEPLEDGEEYITLDFEEYNEFAQEEIPEEVEQIQEEVEEAPVQSEEAVEEPVQETDEEDLTEEDLTEEDLTEEEEEGTEDSLGSDLDELLKMAQESTSGSSDEKPEITGELLDILDESETDKEAADPADEEPELSSKEDEATEEIPADETETEDEVDDAEVLEQDEKVIKMLFDNQERLSGATFNEPDGGFETLGEKTAFSKKTKMIIAANIAAVCVLSTAVAWNIATKSANKTADTTAYNPPITDNLTPDTAVPTMDPTFGPIPAEVPLQSQNPGNQVIPVEQEADISSSIVDDIKTGGAPIMIGDLSWEVPEALSQDAMFRRYLQIAGKNIKLNLESDMLNANEFAYNDKIKISMSVQNNTEVRNLNVAESSGSKSVDKLVLQSIKQTLKYINSPVITTETSNREIILVIDI